MSPLSPIWVLIAAPMDADIGKIVMESMAGKYRRALGYAGQISVEYHVVEKKKPIEERIRQLSPMVCQGCDLVVWTPGTEEEGQAFRAHIEKYQNRQPGTLHWGTVALVSGPLSTRPIHRSDLYLCVPEGSDPVPAPAADADTLYLRL